MSLREIWIPQALIVIFLIIPALRPLIKKLWPIDGLSWLPLLALGTMAGIFPAYGFRPECLPMLIFVILYNLININALVSSIKRRPGYYFNNRRFFRTVLLIVILGAAALPMFVFLPINYDGPNIETVFVKTTKITDAESKNEYFLQIFGNIQENKPAIFIVPPDFGSSKSIEFICSGLCEKGFIVITYSRKGYDNPLTTENSVRYLSSFGKLFSHWNVNRNVNDNTEMNEERAGMEKERKYDVEFLLPRLVSLINNSKNNKNPPLLFIGYGAGGSAIFFLAQEKKIFSNYQNIIGIIAVESRLWSASIQRKNTEIFKPTGSIDEYRLQHYNEIFKGESQTWLERQTETQLSAKVPVLFIVSGRMLDYQEEENPYKNVLEEFHFTSGPVALAAIENAGPFDYQDFPFTHPIYSFFFSGKQSVKKEENSVKDTINLFSNFAFFLLERDGHQFSPPGRINGSLYVESKAMPGLRLR